MLFNINDNLKEVFSHYDFDYDAFVGTRKISIGHINNTYVIYFDMGSRVKRYLLQRINTNVFKDPVGLMQNIKNTTTYAKNMLKSFEVENYKNKIIRIYQTKDGDDFVRIKNGDYYRVYHYIEGGVTYNTSSDENLFNEAGRAIGFFQNMLANYPAEKLTEVIPNFHNTPVRFKTFEDMLNKSSEELKATCKEEIDFFLSNKEIAYSIQPLIDNGTMPIRVTHNDTKLNNIMFDSETNKALCLVDLDTIMPGSICYDFGDFVRTGCNMGEEDAKDLSTIKFNKDVFKSFAEGYVRSVSASITDVELNNLTQGAILMTYECGMRFLTDYLDGNNYFHVEYPEHNLVRARTQIAYVKQLLEKKEELDTLIRDIYKQTV